MNKEQLEALLQYARENNLMKQPVTTVIELWKQSF